MGRSWGAGVRPDPRSLSPSVTEPESFPLPLAGATAGDVRRVTPSVGGGPGPQPLSRVSIARAVPLT